MHVMASLKDDRFNQERDYKEEGGSRFPEHLLWAKHRVSGTAAVLFGPRHPLRDTSVSGFNR